MPPPLISIVGQSRSGKTTFIEKLLPELKARGYRVATIKHVPGQAQFDKREMDSWRHLEAGSEATIISAGDETVLIKPSPSAALGDLVHLLGDDYDIILAEGFKKGEAPKIEVHRREIGPPLTGLRKLFAQVTDEPLEAKVRQFSLEDVKGVADLLEKGFIKPNKERLSVYVNGSLLSLRAFPRRIITSVLLAMVSSLKGVAKVRRLEVWLKKPFAED